MKDACRADPITSFSIEEEEEEENCIRRRDAELKSFGLEYVRKGNGRTRVLERRGMYSRFPSVIYIYMRTQHIEIQPC